MSIITYYLKNINIINKIHEYSNKEDLQCIAVNDLNIDDLCRVLILFTDINDNEIFYKFKNKYICCIGFTPTSNIYYVRLEEDFNLFHFRAIVDSSFKGGLLNIYLSDIVPKSLYVKYEITNRIFDTDEIVYSITKNFVYFFKIRELQKMRVGICEMITNAIEHGNLDITGDEKFHYTSQGNYTELLKTKLEQKDFQDKKVIVEIKINKNKLKINIEDEGKGFDTSIIKEYCNLTDTSKLHGRGIMITTLYFESIRYNKKGNKVTLIKSITSPA